MQKIIDRIWLSGENWYGLEWELTWTTISNVIGGEEPGQAFWYAMMDWDV